MSTSTLTSPDIIPDSLAVTGRISSFIQDASGRLPVSCTVFVVEPEYLSSDGIAASILFTSYALRYGAGVAVHLYKLINFRSFPTYAPKFYLSPDHPEYNEFIRHKNTITELPTALNHYVRVADSMEESVTKSPLPTTIKSAKVCSIEQSWAEMFAQALLGENDAIFDLSDIRPINSKNNKGLVASGAVSFLKIMLTILEFLHQGSLTNLARVYSVLNEVLRRGGLYKNGAIVLHNDYDNPNASEFIQLSRQDIPWARLCLNVDQGFTIHSTLEKAIPVIQAGDLFLVKKQYDENNERIHHNVCLEILLPHRGTCLLSHVNLGDTSVDTIASAFVECMEWLCSFHGRTGVGYPYLTPDEDRQVGLGVIGLANLLAREGVSYKEFVNALNDVIAGKDSAKLRDKSNSINAAALDIATAIYNGINSAAEVARSYNMRRAFTVAPTASCSFRYTDSRGYVTTPEISPPVDRQIIRVSETAEQLIVDYPPDVEIADEVGFDTYFELIDAWQRMMNSTGLAHSISSNWWSDRVQMNRDFIEKWMASSWRSLYYALPVEPAHDEAALLDAVACMDDVCSMCAE